MRKIAFIASNEYVPWGGSEFCWSAAAERLAQRGVQVWASVRDWGKPVPQIEHLRSLGCHIAYRRAPSFARRLRRKIFPAEYQEIEHLESFAAGADLVVVSQGNNFDGLPWLEASKAKSYKYALIVQSCSEHYWPTDDSAERLADCYEGSRAAFFVSQANLELTRRQLVTPLRHAAIIRNPFNVRYDAR